MLEAMTTPAPFDLERFRRAQEHGEYNRALGEMRVGAKRSHWIWYIFPQLRGLGTSSQAVTFGLDGVGEALAYANDALLGERLVTIVAAAAAHLAPPRPMPLVELMGSRIDVQKLMSSMTLFAGVAARAQAAGPRPDLSLLGAGAGQILAAGQAQGYPTCALTRAALEGFPWDAAGLSSRR